MEATNTYPKIKHRFISYALPIASAVLLAVAPLDYMDGFVVTAGFHLAISVFIAIMIVVTRYANRPTWAIHTFLGSTTIALVGQCFLAPNDESLPLWLVVFPILYYFVAGPREGLKWSLGLLFLFTLGTYTYPAVVGLPGVSDVIYGNAIVAFLMTMGLSHFYEKVSVDYQEMLQAQIRTDYLTGIGNRRAVMEKYGEKRRPNPSPSTNISTLLIDIDYFKRINDIHGHDRGDEVLRVVAQLIGSNIRQADMAARWGGEEFLVILSEINPKNAVDLAERIRKSIEAHPFAQGMTVTVSVGVAAGGEDHLEKLIKRADIALYQAKELGRNRIILNEKEDGIVQAI